MKAVPAVTAVAAVATRAVKDAPKVAAMAVAAVAKVAVAVVAEDAASAPVKARANASMRKANQSQAKWAPMAHVQHPTWQARKHRVVNPVASVHPVLTVAIAVSAVAASATNRANARQQRIAVSHVVKAAASAVLIATVARRKARALKAWTLRPVCRSKAQQPKVQTVANPVALKQRPRAQTARSRVSAAHVAAIATVARVVNALSATNPANVRNGLRRQQNSQ